MQYMLLLYSDESARPAPGSDEMNAEMPKWFAYTNELAASGALVSANALQGVEAATSIQVRGGKTVSTDGPFAETKEVLGGYYLIDVADLDEATRWAEKVPSSGYGTVEIRPIMEIPEQS